MPSYQLVPSLVRLRSDFNALAPSRDKASDGWIGDVRHQAGTSDHNPDAQGDVHAIDVDITGPWPDGLTMEKIVQFVIGRCRAGKERRLKYVIFNRRIWSASNQWRTSDYHGSNPHDHHAHFSASYNNIQESNTTSWRLADLIPPKDSNPEVPVQPNDVADSIAGRDIDPSANRYSWSGADFTTFLRTARIGPMADMVDEIAARVEDQADDLDEMTAALTVISAQLSEVLKRLAAPASAIIKG